MEISVDYFTVRLHEEGGKFDYHAFVKWLEKERVDEKTGNILPPPIQAHQFRIKTMQDKTIVVSFYSGAEPMGIKLAKLYDLPVTRIDLAIDQDFATPEECEAAFNDITGDIREWIDKQPNKPTFFNFEGRQSNKNGEFGVVLFSRASPKQLSVYAKRDQSRPGTFARKLRYEWRTHSHVAKEIWPLVANKYPLNKSALYNIHQTLTEKFLEDDFFGLGEYEPQKVKLTRNPNPEDNFTYWAVQIVPKALYRHFKSTGIDLTPQVRENFLKMIIAESEDKEKKVKTKEQAAVAAAYHRLRGRLGILSKGEPLPEEDTEDD